MSTKNIYHAYMYVIYIFKSSYLWLIIRQAFYTFFISSTVANIRPVYAREIKLQLKSSAKPRGRRKWAVYIS